VSKSRRRFQKRRRCICCAWIQDVEGTQEISEGAALYLSPRTDAPHNMLVLAPGVVAPISAAPSGARSASSLINITPFQPQRRPQRN
jgi:hypothetical protein